MIKNLQDRYNCLNIQTTSQKRCLFLCPNMNYPIVNLLKSTNLDELNKALGTKYRRVQNTTIFDKQLKYHKITDFEYRYYKKLMEQESKGI
jgi:hypothetical protein